MATIQKRIDQIEQLQAQSQDELQELKQDQKDFGKSTQAEQDVLCETIEMLENTKTKLKDTQ